MAGMYTGSSAVAKGSNPHPHGRWGREKHTPGARNSQNPAKNRLKIAIAGKKGVSPL